MYSAKITYPIYDLNNTLFIGIIQEVLEAEFLKQRTAHSKDFLPTSVKNDDYLINPISDNEINPSFCAVTKVSSDLNDHFYEQENLDNSFIIQVVAIGLENLRKITDAIYIILNDMDVKNYLFQVKNDFDELLISNSGSYSVKTIVTNLETKKTINDKDIVMGNLVLNVQISEKVKFNDTTPIDILSTTLKLGGNDIELNQETKY